MCEHATFEGKIDVNRVDDENPRAPSAFMADVRIFCTACGEPFAFVGLPVGLSLSTPRTSVDATEVRLPIRPRSAPRPPAEVPLGWS